MMLRERLLELLGEWDSNPDGDGRLEGEEAVLDFLHMPEVVAALQSREAAAALAPEPGCGRCGGRREICVGFAATDVGTEPQLEPCPECGYAAPPVAPEQPRYDYGEAVKYAAEMGIAPVEPAELWAAAQLAPGEGIEDGVARIKSLMGEPAETPETDALVLAVKDLHPGNPGDVIYYHAMTTKLHERACQLERERNALRVRAEMFESIATKRFQDLEALRQRLAEVERERDDWREVARRNEPMLYERWQQAEAARDKAVNVIDCACNALTDSIEVSGNDAATNMHWVRKLRAEARALKGTPNG